MTEEEIIKHLESEITFVTRDDAARHWNQLMKQEEHCHRDFWLFKTEDGRWTFEVVPNSDSRHLLEVKGLQD